MDGLRLVFFCFWRVYEVDGFNWLGWRTWNDVALSLCARVAGVCGWLAMGNVAGECVGGILGGDVLRDLPDEVASV